jgi:ABC-2 type transport system ATP-binding protein
MIEVNHLRKVYGDTVAVDDVSFEVPEGEILGFLGPNGAGKTTTMRILTGFTPASGGRAVIGGFDVSTQSRQVRSILGYLPESAPVYGEMTVRGYVDFFAEVKGLGGAARRRAVDLALEECGLDDVAERLLMNLSKGYRQRAALAQAVVGDPRVVILDEPTVGLDPRQIRGIRSLIRKMAQRRTVVLSTHILSEVSLTCTRVLIIKSGRVVATGTPDNLESNIERPNRMVVCARGAFDSVHDALSRTADVEHVRLTGPHPADPSVTGDYEFHVTLRSQADARALLARTVIEAGHDLLELRSVGLSLEDVFLHTISSGEAERVEA